MREEWYKYLDLAQQRLNTAQKLCTFPFSVLFGIRVWLRNNYEVCELLEKEWISKSREDRDGITDRVKENIAKIQKKINADSIKSEKRHWVITKMT